MPENVSLILAQKLLSLFQGQKLPASQLKYKLIDELLSESILYKSGNKKGLVYIAQSMTFTLFLKTRMGISDLETYIEALKKEDITRGELVQVSSNSKTKKVRTFKGFLVNSYIPIEAMLNEKPIIIHPTEGTFQFIYDFEKFRVASDVTVVGIENSENFRFISKQKYLFEEIKSLFVSRYPQNQSKDLIKWLKSIPNNYLHFGDFDFAGINIYLSEYKKYLGEKATFFVPENLGILMSKHGESTRYDIQKMNFDVNSLTEQNLKNLVDIIHKYKRGLDQEVYIRNC